MERAVWDFLERARASADVHPANGGWLADAAGSTDIAFPPDGGWPLGYERGVARHLVEITAEMDMRGVELDLFVPDAAWVEVFRIGELLIETSPAHMGAPAVELWNTRRLRLAGWSIGNDTFQGLRAIAFSAVAEQHIGSSGWHLHPTIDRRHLGYRLFFDKERTQNDLSWELHSERRLDTPWGDPSNDVLAASTSRRVHAECQKAVRHESALAPRYTPFSVWAGRFGTPVSKAFVAHPPVDVVTPW